MPTAWGQRCAIYSRFSNLSAKDTGEVSLADQERVNIAWATENGFTNIVAVISEIISGARADRAGMNQCLDLAQRGEIDAIVCYDFKRFSRQDELESAALLYQFKQVGVKVLFSTEPNGDDVATQVFMALRRIFSPMDRRDITQRMQRGKVRSMEQRQRVVGTGRRPFGLRYLPKPDYRFELVPEEAEWIPRMAAMVLAGGSLYKVAQMLTASGVRTATGKERWAATSVKSILSNPLYTGVYYWGKTTAVEPKRRFKPDTRYLKTSQQGKDRSEWLSVTGTVTVDGEDVDIVPHIITPELFESVQEALKRNGEQSARNCKRDYLLRGLGRCMVCGRRLIGHAANTGKGRVGQRYYWCHNGQGRPQDDPADLCSVRMIPADKLEELVWSEVVRQVSDPDVIAENLRQRESEGSKERARLEGELGKLELSERKTKSEKALLYELLRDGGIDRDIYDDRLFLLRKDEAVVGKLKNEVLEQMRVRERTEANIQDIYQLTEQVQRNLPFLDFEAKREFLASIQVVVTADKRNVRISGLLQEAVLSMLSKQESKDVSRLQTLSHGPV